MELTKTVETTGHQSSDGGSISPSRQGSLGAGADGSWEDASQQIVAQAWALKSTMHWVRDDRSVINAFRWSLSDRYGLGHPPSKVQTKSYC